MNADYSSISESHLDTVISSCYEQILKVQDSLALPVALEMTGSTALKLDELRPKLLETIRERVRSGKIAIISGGMYQIIGPLVPHEVTYRNHKRGVEVLAKLFGFSPTIVLPSEQAISDGTLEVLENAGYRAAIVDLDNYGSPQENYIRGFPRGPMKLVWASSSVYQWVQQYIHGDITLEDIVTRIRQRVPCYGDDIPFPLYSGDAETFGFRPGRYMTESEVDAKTEWSRFSDLIVKLREECGFDFTCQIQPAAAPSRVELPGLFPSIPQEPIRVKKQPKYNVSRWAVSGRGDFELNASCWEKLRILSETPTSSSQDWDELLRLWSSDFRTHLTEEKWTKLLSELPQRKRARTGPFRIRPTGVPPASRFVENPRSIEITTEEFVIVIDKNRGLTLSSVRRKESTATLFGKVPHGTFLRPDLSPDWYSGNMTLQIPGHQQVTDLTRCRIVANLEGSIISITTDLKFSQGTLQKKVSIDMNSSEINVQYILPSIQRNGSLRLGYISILREKGEDVPLRYSTQNGGYGPETYAVGTQEFEMGAAVSHLVSARTGLGMTGGWIHFLRTDINEQFLVTFEQSQNPYLGLLSNSTGPEGALTRFCLTAMERDDTLASGIFETSLLGYSIRPGMGIPRN